MIGAGGLGCATVLALLAQPKISGLDRIILVDPDQVELSNLHRQVLFTMEDLGADKVQCVAQQVEKSRADWQVVPVVRRLQGVGDIVAMADGCELIVDGSDNVTTRFEANDAALQRSIPLVHGAAIGFRGQLMTLLPGQSACLRCLFYGPPATEGASCRSDGVLGPLVGEVGWLMAMEVVKILTQQGAPLLNRLLTIDGQKQRRHTVPLQKRAGCTGCGNLGLLA